jgi:uncharacterized membrane protein
MARSIAILLMLEGHFVDDSLALSYRDNDNIVFFTWEYIRGFTGPIFLTITGLIFVYLLLRNRDTPFFQNIRIRKGFKRVIELIFWGSVVQWYAFHVLECIAIGIFSILIIYGLYKLIRFIPLWIYFFAAGMAVFGLYKYVEVVHGGETFVEKGILNFFKFIYNPDRKTVAWFTIFPSMGFTMFGAMIGALLHDLSKHVRKWYFASAVFISGAILYFMPRTILGGLDAILNLITDTQFPLVYADWLVLKLGMVLMVLSALMTIDNLYGNKIKETNLFLKVGQNTLTIYILHMIILYGSITTYGLNDLFNKKWGIYELPAWGVALGAVLFIAFFVLLIKYLDWIKLKLEFILKPIRLFFNRLFFVSS